MNRQVVAVLVLLAGLSGFGQGLAQAQSCRGNECLTKDSQCDKADIRIQTDASKFSNEKTIDLAAACFAKAKTALVTTSPLSVSIQAYNAARLYDEAARRATKDSDRAGYWALAGEAAQLSREKASDDAAGFNNARVKRDRLAILVRTLFERGLAPELATSCGGEKTCLTEGVSRFDAAILNPSSEAGNANSRMAFSELQILKARASARLHALSPGNGDFERAIEALKSVMNIERGSNTDASKAIVSKAATYLVDLTTAEANRILTDRVVSVDSISRAIIYLEDADSVVATPALAAQRPKIKLSRGKALVRRADLRSVVESAQKSSDLCNALRVFEEGLGGASSSDVQIGLREGAGQAAARLARTTDATCNGLSKTGLEDKALAALDEGWRLRKGASMPANLDVLPDHISLLQQRGRVPEPELLAALRGATGEQAMRVQLALAVAAAQTRPTTAATRKAAEDYFAAAISAFSTAPEPELERGKFFYALAQESASDASALRTNAERDLASAIGKADRDTSRYAKVRAEAYYFRSLNETAKNATTLMNQASRDNAARWAKEAVFADSANVQYSYQACRAALMARANALGDASQLCSVNASTSEGAVLKAFMLFRDAQIQRKARTPAPPSVFRQAEDAFQAARDIWVAEKAAGKIGKIDWPAGGGAYDTGYVIEYGRWLSRECTLTTEAGTAAPTGTPDASRLFGRYGVFYCNRFDVAN